MDLSEVLGVLDFALFLSKENRTNNQGWDKYTVTNAWVSSNLEMLLK